MDVSSADNPVVTILVPIGKEFLLVLSETKFTEVSFTVSIPVNAFRPKWLPIYFHPVSTTVRLEPESATAVERL